MKIVDKTKEQLINLVTSLEEQVRNLLRLRPALENREKELKEIAGTIEEQVHSRTSAERIVSKQLHTEIEQRKQFERVIQDALEYANSIINTVHEPLVVLDADLRVISASRYFYQVFKVRPDETEMQHIYSLGNGQWDIPELRELLENILPKTACFDDFVVEQDFPVIGKRTMLLNAREVYQKAKRTKFILLAIEDITERRALEDKLKNLASHDELTGCFNFRSIMEILEREISRCRRYQKVFSIIMIDMDHFKRINDELGHLVGNEALMIFGAVLRNSVRSIDLVGRYGGDEFIIVLPESDSRHALVALERIRNNLGQAKISSPRLEKEKEIVLKFSAGIAVFPDNAKEIKDLIRFADSSLLQAKKE
jgi:diguanylate cyclase (GGDEF)-like protein